MSALSPVLSSKTPSTRISLIARLRKGKNSSAWPLFVELYTPLIYHYCRRRSLQDADACDVSQAVMARVFRAIGTFEYDAERGRFRDWLGAITSREFNRHRGRQAKEIVAAGGGEGDSIADRTPAASDAQWVEAFNSHLLDTAVKRIRPAFDEATWKAFDLTWIGDIKPHAAAEALGKTAAWIYKSRFRVLKRLRQEVEFLAEDAAPLQPLE
jgi:RNA polymerase sigma-70 factor, ECF subfamily